DRTLVRKIRKMVLRNSAGDFKGQIEAALTRADQSRYLPTIQQQVVLLCGDNDTWSPLSQHQEIQQQLPSAVLHSIPKAGHMVTMEQPEAVNEILLDWIGASQGRAVG